MEFNWIIFQSIRFFFVVKTSIPQFMQISIILSYLFFILSTTTTTKLWALCQSEVILHPLDMQRVKQKTFFAYQYRHPQIEIPFYFGDRFLMASHYRSVGGGSNENAITISCKAVSGGVPPPPPPPSSRHWEMSTHSLTSFACERWQMEELGRGENRAGWGWMSVGWRGVGGGASRPPAQHHHTLSSTMTTCLPVSVTVTDY